MNKKFYIVCWSVVCMVVVFSVVMASDKADTKRNLAYDKCYTSYLDNALPFEAREGYLSNCMDK